MNMESDSYLLFSDFKILTQVCGLSRDTGEPWSTAYWQETVET